MLVLSQPITSINGFKIGDKVRLKDGDGRPHIIKAFAIDGLKEFFFIVQFEDGIETTLDNISYLLSNLKDAAEEYAPDFSNDFASKAAVEAIRDAFKAGAEWQEREIRIFLANSLV